MRPTVADVIGHPWLRNGPTATHEQVVQEFSARHLQIEQLQAQAQADNQSRQ